MCPLGHSSTHLGIILCTWPHPLSIKENTSREVRTALLHFCVLWWICLQGIGLWSRRLHKGNPGICWPDSPGHWVGGDRKTFPGMRKQLHDNKAELKNSSWFLMVGLRPLLRSLVSPASSWNWSENQWRSAFYKNQAFLLFWWKRSLQLWAALNSLRTSWSSWAGLNATNVNEPVARSRRSCHLKWLHWGSCFPLKSINCASIFTIKQCVSWW